MSVWKAVQSFQTSLLPLKESAQSSNGEELSSDYKHTVAHYSLYAFVLVPTLHFTTSCSLLRMYLQATVTSSLCPVLQSRRSQAHFIPLQEEALGFPACSRRLFLCTCQIDEASYLSVCTQ